MTASVKPPLTRVRVGNDEYAGFVRRVLAAHGRRVAAGDVDDLIALIELDTEVQAALRAAVAGLRAEGVSWTDIGSRLGVSRQAAQQRWGGRS